MKKTIKQFFFGVSEWFLQDSDFLKNHKEIMKKVLLALGRSSEDIKEYCKAYDFFVKHPTKYDGSTFVSDLFIIRLEDRDRYGQRLKLSVDSMYHDYESILFANKNYIKWIKSAWKYIKNLNANGKGWRISRFIGLLILGIPFVIYKNITK